jgi:hypothetical protein
MADVEVDSITIEHVQEIIETVVGVASDPDVSVDEAFYAALLIESSRSGETGSDRRARERSQSVARQFKQLAHYARLPKPHRDSAKIVVLLKPRNLERRVS